MFGLYVHIPFCNKICPYCDFYKLVASDHLKEKFIDALSQEMKIKKLDDYLFDSLYIGGGSPSCLKLELLEKLFLNLSQYVNFLNLKEFNSENIVIKKRLIIYSINKTIGNIQNIEKVNIDDIIKLCEKNIGNKYLMPNKNIKVLVNKNQIFFEAKE